MASTDYHRKAKLLFAVIVCGAALAAGLWYRHYLAQYATYRVETHDPVSGLIVDSPVEFHGVEVGNVTKIELTDPRTVNILLRVAKDAPVGKATVARIIARGLAARGFTGYVYVALENTAAESGPLTIDSGQRVPVIATAPALTDTMDTTVADAVQQVRLLTRLLQSVLDEKTIVSVKQSVDRFNEIIGPLAANNERLNSLIVNAERDSRSIGQLLDAKTVASLKGSMDGLQQVMATLVANDERLSSLIVNAERDSREIGPLLENAERASREIKPLLETSNATLGQLHEEVLPQLTQSLGNLDGLTRSLGGLADKLARDPSAIIRGTVTPPGPGER